METLLEEIVKARSAAEEIETWLEDVPEEAVAYQRANTLADDLERLERDIRSSLLTGETIR